MKGDCRLYLSRFSMPHICSPLQGQKVEVAEAMFPIIKNFDRSDLDPSDGKIDMLIGSDYYWEVVDGEAVRCDVEGLVAMKSKLGWLLSGACGMKDNVSAAVHLASTHVMLVDFDADEENSLSTSVEKFWDLDTIGIKPNEVSVYDKFLDNV